MTNLVSIFLLSFGLLQGTLLGVYLARKQKRSLVQGYLALILTVAALQMTFKLVSKVWLGENLRQLYFLSYFIPYLMGPLLFLFTKTHIAPFNKKDLFHFGLFLFLVCTSLLQNINLPLNLIEWVRLPLPVVTLLQCLILGGYCILCWQIIAQHESLVKFKLFVVIITTTEMIVVITLALLYAYYPAYQELRFVFIAFTLIIYWMSYKVMTEPYFFGEITGARLVPKESIKYHHSGLKEEDATRIYVELQRVMDQEKPYLNSDLTIDFLAKQLGTTRHYLSQIINERVKKSYGEMINDYRAAMAQERLANPKYKHLTIASIALDCGFNSVSGFNEIFKRKLGVTPSKFREERLEKMTA